MKTKGRKNHICNMIYRPPIDKFKVINSYLKHISSRKSFILTGAINLTLQGFEKNKIVQIYVSAIFSVKFCRC